MTEQQEAAVEEYLRLVRETTDPEAIRTPEGMIHFDEYDEYNDRYVPVIVNPEDAERKILEMYDLGGC